MSENIIKQTIWKVFSHIVDADLWVFIFTFVWYFMCFVLFIVYVCTALLPLGVIKDDTKIISGVTVVVVIRCGNLWCHPIFSLKYWRPISVIVLSKVIDLFIAIVSSPLPPSPPSNVVCTVFFVNSAAKNSISLGCHPPEFCHPGRSASPSPL